MTYLFLAESKAPELPNIITLVYHHFNNSTVLKFLHEWENIFFSFLLVLFLWLIAYLGTRRQEMVPRGLQNFVEFVVDSMRKLVVEVLGEEGERYLPFLGTLFIYILGMNLMGMIPFLKSPSSSLNVTIALAIVVFCLVQYLNIRNMGVGGFLYHLAGSPKTTLNWCLSPLMFFLELLTQLTRPFTLALRLFGNILGEDILVATFALFGLTLLADFNSPVGLPLQLPFVLLAILLSFMQALVFTLLSAVYILLSIPSKDEGH